MFLKKRVLDTPDSVSILANMDNFISKWEAAEHNGNKILTEKVVVQLRLLRTHIERGCLSEIEPSGGTNYNEALHRLVNPHFSHAGRMGLPLAYALLTILLYNHNRNKKSDRNSDDSVERKISLKLHAHTPTASHVSLGIISKKLNITDDDCELMVDNEGPSMISIEDMERIMRKSLAAADLAKSMSQMIKQSPNFSYHMMPFMSHVPSLFFHTFNSSHAQKNEELHEERLKHTKCL